MDTAKKQNSVNIMDEKYPKDAVIYTACGRQVKKL